MAATAVRSCASQAAATFWPVPATVFSSLADSPAVPGFCTRYGLVIAYTVSSRSGSTTQVRLGRVWPMLTSLPSRPPGASSVARLSSRSTGIWSLSGMVWATSSGAWVIGHSVAIRVCLPLGAVLNGRKVRAMPSGRSSSASRTSTASSYTPAVLSPRSAVDTCRVYARDWPGARSPRSALWLARTVPSLPVGPVRPATRLIALRVSSSSLGERSTTCAAFTVDELALVTRPVTVTVALSPATGAESESICTVAG
ncbi:hypothetical protein ACFQ1I_23695 [Kitasatospora arboriphila]